MDKLLIYEDIILTEMEYLQSHMKKILNRPLNESEYLINQCINEIESVMNTVVESFAKLKND